MKITNYEAQGIYPLVSVSGGFLIKGVALLGISAWSLADALRATRSSLAGSSQPHAI
jgi:reactive chlorine resistance protein C